MKDVFDAYKQQKMKKNITIVSLALLFGIGINIVLFSAPAKQFQASVGNFGDNGQVVVAKDIRLVPEKNVEIPSGDKTELKNPKMLSLVNSTGLTGVKEVRASFLYDPNSLTLSNFFSENKDAQIIKMSNEAGIITINVHYKDPIDISTDTKILRMDYEKKNDAKTVINLAQTTFVTNNGTYELTNESTEL